ncbi:hypothetical protein IQ251_12765 [Saccharopolyspora sp. HNM0983]|uniref:Uncharacterized protein n=1 Tax=Saccharopolyspora montiporae TaxID=2781240 RepID=A0A929B8Q7_9PSEU|nr:hypothetical protein [Saccharopolyspora sp. HNM0983]MBE9375317.1 hypothetical protein [Saccharopolyspora sp. HNM0983]
MNRVLNIARVQLLTPVSSIALPWLILALSMAINLAIFALLRDEESATTGGLSTLYIFVFVAALMIVREHFPFSLGLSVTRRMFFAATAGRAVAEALVYGAVLLVLALIERATGGWGVQMTFFDLPYLQELGPVLRLLSYAGPLLLMSFLGIFIGTLTKRWGNTGMFTVTAAALIVLGGGSVLMTLQQWWGPFGTWILAQPVATLTIGYPVLLAALLAGGGYLVLRRTTP